MNNVVDINDRIYCIEVSCWNCTVCFTARIPKGTLFSKWNGECPHCGCTQCFHPIPGIAAQPYGIAIGQQIGLDRAGASPNFRDQKKMEEVKAKIHAETLEYQRRMQELDKIDPK